MRVCVCHHLHSDVSPGPSSVTVTFFARGKSSKYRRCSAASFPSSAPPFVRLRDSVDADEADRDVDAQCASLLAVCGWLPSRQYSRLSLRSVSVVASVWMSSGVEPKSSSGWLENDESTGLALTTLRLKR